MERYEHDLAGPDYDGPAMARWIIWLLILASFMFVLGYACGIESAV